MTNIFFTSDTHFGHKRVLKHRNFSSTEEMDEVLIKNWNNLISQNDEVYHLGDFSFSSKSRTKWIISRLNGNKILILGNHDKRNINSEIKSMFSFVKDYYELKVFKDQKIVLCHYPFLIWNKSHYGSWHLHGHSHGNLKSNTKKESKRIDVGVDTNHLFPYALEEIKDIMDKLPIFVDDHHKIQIDS